MTRRTFAAAVMATLAGAVPSAAQTPPASGEALMVHPEAREAIGKLKSPYCPGMMLEVCPSPGGAMLRDSIQSMAVSGLVADSIIERIVALYGEEWRAEPRRSGAGGWAWLLPPVGLLAGLAAVVAVLVGRRATPPTLPAVPDPAPEDAVRLREALAELEEEEEPVF